MAVVKLLKGHALEIILGIVLVTGVVTTLAVVGEGKPTSPEAAPVTLTSTAEGSSTYAFAYNDENDDSANE